MEIKQNSFKLKHMPFSLSPKTDAKTLSAQNISFLNVFSIKDQNRIPKKNKESLNFSALAERLRESLSKMPKKLFKELKPADLIDISRESIIKTPKEQKNETKVLIKHISNHAKLTEKPIKIKEITVIRAEKKLEIKENEVLTNLKTSKREKEMKNEKYRNTHENELKIFYYFRFHLHSLLINTGKRDKIEEINNNNAIHAFLPNIRKKEVL